ncbi:hypothetical protein BofuT4_uP145280.1 [Botrytis cinerea T4]|uniref:Uncharacterized protein n=1 Tax=Botryotinia fuckeliana (strain T4) TaxID=999810 RepID=G2YYM2_BOTF4|nr:hypothetical protein BofuT4_uP145280.1 [Botrytis cinerea T4]
MWWQCYHLVFYVNSLAGAEGMRMLAEINNSMSR